MAKIHLLLESWCRDEGAVVAGVFSTRERALAARLEACAEARRNPESDRTLRVEEFEIDVLVPLTKRELLQGN
jgi:hypothetical protein